MSVNGFDQAVRAALVTAGEAWAGAWRAEHPGMATRVVADAAGLSIEMADAGLAARLRGAPGTPPRAVLGQAAAQGERMLGLVASALRDGLS